MRDEKRLDGFYEEFCKIHKKSFPDMRFGQLMICFIGWVQKTKKRDLFFPEESELIELFREYANTESMLYREN